MKKILVVEDDKTTRVFLTGCLKNLSDDVCVLQCSDGNAGWIFLTENLDIDLVVTDVQLPGLTGRELVMKMRDHETLRQIPVIMTSGVVGIREVVDLLEKGVDRFIPKPVKADELREYAQKLLTRSNPSSHSQPI